MESYPSLGTSYQESQAGWPGWSSNYGTTELLLWNFRNYKTQSTMESQVRWKSPHFSGPQLGLEWSYRLGKNIYLELISSFKRLDYDSFTQKVLNTRKLRKIGTFYPLLAIHNVNWTVFSSTLLWAITRPKMKLKSRGKRLHVDNLVLYKSGLCRSFISSTELQKFAKIGESRTLATLATTSWRSLRDPAHWFNIIWLVNTFWCKYSSTLRWLFQKISSMQIILFWHVWHR